MLNLGDICDEIKQIAREVEVRGGSEEDLKVRVEQILRREAWDKLGVPEPSYEYKVKGVTAKHWKRIDALYGLVIIEYKKPNELSKIRTREEAIEKMKKEYIQGILNDPEAYKHIKAIKDKGYDERLKKRGTLVPTEVANLRTAIRNELREELEEIDRLVIDLLKSSGAKIKSNPHATLDMFGIT